MKEDLIDICLRIAASGVVLICMALIFLAIYAVFVLTSAVFGGIAP
jgi:hypothetical protein